jgi:hypothetical protein
MSTISIDNKEYKLEDLSEETKAQLVSMQFVDAEINRLQAQLAAMQTARNAYAQAVSGLLVQEEKSH